MIWRFIVEYWKSFIKRGSNLPTPTDMEPGTRKTVPQDKFVIEASDITFPDPKSQSSCININMMPFVMNPNFEDCYLPEILREHWKQLVEPLFTSYHAHADLQEGKICFLTIHESLVKCDQSQRRPGLHTDNPGKLNFMDEKVTTSSNNQRTGMPEEERSTSYNDNHTNAETSKGGGSSHANFYEHHWGMEVNLRRNEVEGGIYMASNVPRSCAVWNSQVQSDESKKGNEIIGKHGDIEFLRPYIGNRRMMKPNCIYWITDRTPHESLPVKEETYRQYFRLVTHQVSLWFEDHSTKNPFGLLPDPKITKIVRGSKFGDPGQLKVVSDYEQNIALSTKEMDPNNPKQFHEWYKDIGINCINIE